MDIGKQECLEFISKVKYSLINTRQNLEDGFVSVGGFRVKASPEICGKITEVIIMIEDHLKMEKNNV